MKKCGLVLLGLIILGFGIDQGFDAFIQLALIYVLVNMILGMSLNLVNGFTGQFSLGHAGFMAVGAYTSAFLSSYVTAFDGFTQIPILLGLAAASGLVAAFAGYIVGLPSLKLRGDYLAIVTLGFGEIIRVVLLNTPAVGGARGFYGIPGAVDFNVGPITIDKFWMSYSLAVFWVVTCFFVIRRLLKSAQGRAFMAVREDEVAAEAMGVNTTQAKVRAFVISSFFAGVAGSIFAHYANYLNPATFGFSKSIDAVIIVVLGGMGSLSGSLIAAVFVTAMPELLRPLQQLTGIDIRMVIYALSLILLMILRPKGLFGGQEIWNLFPFNRLRKRTVGGSGRARPT